MRVRAPFGVRSISAPRFVVESGIEESSSLCLGGLTHSGRPPSVRLSCPPSSSVEGASGKGTLDSDTHTHRSTTAPRGGAEAPLVSGERQRRRSHARALTAAGEEGGREGACGRGTEGERGLAATESFL